MLLQKACRLLCGDWLEREIYPLVSDMEANHRWWRRLARPTYKSGLKGGLSRNRGAKCLAERCTHFLGRRVSSFPFGGVEVATAALEEEGGGSCERFNAFSCFADIVSALLARHSHCRWVAGKMKQAAPGLIYVF